MVVTDAPLLVTERLELWLPANGDLAAMRAIVADPATHRFLGPQSAAAHFERFCRNAGSWLLYGYGSFMLRERGGGALINISSIAAKVVTAKQAAYTAVAKGAVTMQTRQDAATYGKDNIRVNSVHPSTVLTPLVEGIARDFDGGLPAYEAVMTSHQSLRRLGRPIDVAYGVLYLASDESSWVTGSELVIDGGWTAQ